MNSLVDQNFLEVVGKMFYHTWWIVLPTTFYYLFKVIYMDYVGFYSVDSWHQLKTYSMLEVIPPREIEKGPKMMESFYTGISGVLSTFNNFDIYLKGALYHDRFSFELVSEEGKIHFYIRTEKKNRDMVEAQIYAQYPDAEIIEVEDYFQRFPKVIPNKNWEMWGTDFEFVLANAYSIKTYDKFEESITGEMNDPMAAIIETLGTLGPGQHCWIQLVVQPLPEGWKKEKAQQEVLDKITGRGTEPPKGVLADLWEVFSNVFAGMFGPVEFKKAEKKEQQPLEFRLTPGEKDNLKAIEDKLGRNCFKTKMRFIIFGKREVFGRTKPGVIIGAIKQFNDINANQFKPEDVTKTYGRIFLKKRIGDFRKRKLWDRYRKRNMDGPVVVLSNKELATIFHFPDMGVKSPSVPRTASKLGAAPPNLPIQ